MTEAWDWIENGFAKVVSPDTAYFNGDPITSAATVRAVTLVFTCVAVITIIVTHYFIYLFIFNPLAPHLQQDQGYVFMYNQPVGGFQLVRDVFSCCVCCSNICVHQVRER
jgi:hypothetical protein